MRYQQKVEVTLIGLALLLSALPLTVVAQLDAGLHSTEQNIGVITNVSKNPASSTFPTMAIEADAKIHVAWSDLGVDGLQVMYSSSPDGLIWSLPKDVSNSRAASAFPSIVVDNLGVVHLTWMEGRGPEFDIYYSHFNHKEWSPPQNISNLKGISQRPQMAIDSAGKIHVVWYDNTGGSFELFHCWQDGTAWTKPMNTNLARWYITEDPAYALTAGLAADVSGHLHLAWTDIYDMTQVLFYSSWNGESWSKTVMISKSPARPRSPYIDTDLRGNIHLTWEANGEVWYSQSKGQAWSVPFNMSEGVQFSNSPALCLAASGDVHFAWSGSLFGKVHLFYRRFDGKKWSQIEKLSEARGRPAEVAISFQNPKTLHVAWVDDSPGNVDVFHKQGLPSEITEAARLEPRNADDFYNRGVSWMRRGNLENALKDFNEAINLDSSYTAAYDDRGAIWNEMGELDKALKDYTEAIRLNPKLADAHNDRGATWWKKGERELALEDYTKAIKLNPKDAGFYYNRGIVWSDNAEWDKALQDFEESVRINPKFERAHDLLAWLLATCPNPEYRDGKRSVELATKACELTNWTRARYLNTLAAAYAELGQYDRAIEWQSKARDMVPPTVRGDYQARLDLYRAGKPYRQSVHK